MRIHRRELLAAGGMLVGASMTGLARGAIQETADLKPTTLPPPIGRDERMARLARARALMHANDIGEMLFFAMVGGIWLAGLASALFGARPRAAVHSLYIAGGIAIAAVFGVFVDMFVAWGPHTLAQTNLQAWLEDGGEFAFINLTFLMVVAFFDAEKRRWRAAAPAQYPAAGAALAA